MIENSLKEEENNRIEMNLSLGCLGRGTVVWF